MKLGKIEISKDYPEDLKYLMALGVGRNTQKQAKIYYKKQKAWKGKFTGYYDKHNNPINYGDMFIFDKDKKYWMTGGLITFDYTNDWRGNEKIGNIYEMAYLLKEECKFGEVIQKGDKHKEA